jgi:hypothetical protein
LYGEFAPNVVRRIQFLFQSANIMRPLHAAQVVFHQMFKKTILRTKILMYNKYTFHWDERIFEIFWYVAYATK